MLRGTLLVFLLQFADDTLIYLPFDLAQLQNLIRILRCFELISGLKINFHKSSILGINGLFKDTWEHVVERFNSKLALWKGSFLSPAGRLVLLKSVLFSVPVYFMSTILMPISIRKNLESCMKRFLWKGDATSRALCKISWKCSGVSHWSSLAIGDGNSLSFIWKGIKKACCSDIFIWNVFISNTRFKLGDEGTIDTMRWNSASSFYSAASFIRFIAAAHLGREEASRAVHQMRQDSGVERQFSGSGRQFTATLIQQFPHPMRNSQLNVVTAHVEGHASTSSAAGRDYFEHSTLDTKLKNGMFSKLWKSLAHPSIKFFLWTALHGRVPSKQFSVIRGIISVENASCCFCNCFETQDHLFMHCVFARLVWNGILNRMGVSWVMPNSMDNFYRLWLNILPKRSYAKLWKLLWIIMVCEIWISRNKKIFQQKDVEVEDIILGGFLKSVFYFNSCNSTFSY
ncbi:uncharacterized protein LOC126681421 [Mercurialis annua]|uniref:uncharacterized protein LOC126681421 n=1 Tax=Mercurialis annua TaxID=3986 RepID=UPI00215ED6DB|nr:uncharacterized protein LOC126681421 [Mercurialis annua]